MQCCSMGKSGHFFGLVVFLLQAVWADSTTAEVSPGGDINSLSAARDKVRQLRQAGTNDDIIVEFQSGTYVETNTVVFGLEDSAPTKEIIAPVVPELVRIKGVNDTHSLVNGYVAQDDPVRGLVFEGLTFAYADRDQFEDGDIILEIGMDARDQASGLLRFRGAEDCVLWNNRWVLNREERDKGPLIHL